MQNRVAKIDVIQIGNTILIAARFVSMNVIQGLAMNPGRTGSAARASPIQILIFP
jgi:hypothetical protein